MTASERLTTAISVSASALRTRSPAASPRSPHHPGELLALLGSKRRAITDRLAGDLPRTPPVAGGLVAQVEWVRAIREADRGRSTSASYLGSAGRTCPPALDRHSPEVSARHPSVCLPGHLWSPTSRAKRVRRSFVDASGRLLPSTARMRSPVWRCAAAGEPATTSPTVSSICWRRRRARTAARRRSAGSPPARPRSSRSASRPAGGSRRGERPRAAAPRRVHAGDLHEAAGEDGADAVLGLSRAGTWRSRAERRGRSAPPASPRPWRP